MFINKNVVNILLFACRLHQWFLKLYTDETVRNLSIEFSVAHLFMFLLIFNEQRVPKFTFVLRKPHLFVTLTAIGWFIVNIQSDLFWHRCLERQAFCTPRKYTKSIKGSNYGEFLKDKNVLLCTWLQVRSEFGKFAYTAKCMHNVYTLIW